MTGLKLYCQVMPPQCSECFWSNSHRSGNVLISPQENPVNHRKLDAASPFSGETAIHQNSEAVVESMDPDSSRVSDPGSSAY